MKGFGATRKFIYRSSELLYAAALFASAIIGIATGADITDSWLVGRPIVIRIVEFIQEYAIPGYILICITVVLSFFYRRMGDPWIWEKIKFILDEYQGKAFTKGPGDPSDHHRITLFKFKKNCVFVKHWSCTNILKPWGNKTIFSNFLVPVLRSGHLSQKSAAVFYVSDNSDSCEGIAAKAWSSEQAVVTDDLPYLKPGAPKTRDLNTYAKITYCDKQMIMKYMDSGRPMPRSIAAIPIIVFGEMWGVIVLDSRLPKGVSSDSVLNFELTVALVGQLLEKAK